MSKLKRFEGMTLVEMMVAIGITAIVMAMTIPIFVSQYGNYTRGRNVRQTQQAGQEVIEILRADLMHAGWSVLPTMAFFFQDGGLGGSDAIVLNDTGIINLDRNPGLRSLLIAGDCAGGARFLLNGGNSLTLSTGLDLNSDGKEDFIGARRQYVISNSTNPLNKVTYITSATDGAHALLGLDGTLGGNYVAPAIYYCVDDGTNGTNCSGDPTPSFVLKRSDRSSGGRSPMAENIVDLQVAYQDSGGFWYGAAGCSGSGFNTKDLCSRNPFDPTQIALIRLSIVSRSPQRDLSRKSDPYYCRPTVENHPAAGVGGDDCGYVYRIYTMLIQPRSTGPLYAQR